MFWKFIQKSSCERDAVLLKPGVKVVEWYSKQCFSHFLICHRVIHVQKQICYVTHFRRKKSKNFSKLFDNLLTKKSIGEKI